MSTERAYLFAHHLLPETDPQDPFHDLTKPVGGAAKEAKEGDSKGNSHPYHVERIKIEDAEYLSEVPEHLQNQEIPGFPSTVAIIGKPGGGKTNLVMNLLLKEIFWNKFFDKIYLLGPTVKMDKLFKNIKVPEDQVVTDSEEFMPKLIEWTTRQKEEVKMDPKRAPKCLFFFEDITAYRQTVQKDPKFGECFTTIRHHKSSAVVNFHKYTALERTARINCMHICVFPVNKTDMDQIYEEYATAHLDKDDFTVMCRFAWKPDEENKKPFLYINMYAEDNKRFRKCFTKIIDTSYFEGLGKVVKQHRKRKAEEACGLREGNKRTKGEDGKQKSSSGFDEFAGNPILESLDTSLKKKMGDMTAKPPEKEVKEKSSSSSSSAEHGPFEPKVKWRRLATDNVFTYLR